MKITLCASAKFFDRLWDIKKSLEALGHEVFLPSMKNYHDLEETALAKIQYDLIKDHFRKIDESDAIYVTNYEKNGIKGYIGGNCFLEMGKAFDRDIPIYLLDGVSRDLPYREEILAMQPVVIGEDWNKLK